jgi:CAI-1 autoinducer synthase
LQLGYAVDQSDTQIIALQSGSDAQTRALRDELEARGVFGAVFCAPATPKNHGVIRLSVNARLHQAELDRVIAICAEVARAKPIKPWPRNLMVAQADSGASPGAAAVVAWPDFGSTAPAAGS